LRISEVNQSVAYLAFGAHIYNTGCFTSDGEPDEVEGATHNTFATLTWIFVF
jgi:hypothetical protein